MSKSILMHIKNEWRINDLSFMGLYCLTESPSLETGQIGRCVYKILLVS